MAEKQKRKVISIIHVWTNILAAIISIIAGVISNMAVFGIKEGKLIYLAIVVAFVAVLITFTQIIKGSQRESSKVVKLKYVLEEAYCNALDNSILNPERFTRSKNA